MSIQTPNEKHRELLENRKILKTYLVAKFTEEDWHGVQDAASDLRDIDSEIKTLEMCLNLEWVKTA